MVGRSSQSSGAISYEQCNKSCHAKQLDYVFGTLRGWFVIHYIQNPCTALHFSGTSATNCQQAVSILQCLFCPVLSRQCQVPPVSKVVALNKDALEGF